LSVLNSVNVPRRIGVMSVPLLFVHGHPFDRTMWRPQLERFSAAHPVLAPDLRGYGAAGGTTPSWTALAEDLLVALAGVPRAVVVGLSMGGQLALELHRIAPGRVAGLLLADTTAEAETDRAGRLAHADRLEREGMGPYAAGMLHRMVRPGSPASTHVEQMMRGTDARGAAAAQRARADRPSYRMGAVAVPTAVVVGAQDDLTPVADARRIADGVPNARLTVVDGAAHLPNLEQPAAFDAALRALLDRVPDAPVW
jgi:3-oxoadipate enol-lactonase